MKITEEICANQNDSDDSEFEDNELEALENIDISSIPLLPSTFDTNEILKSLICHHPVTDQHRKCNDICFSISKDFLEIFLAKQYDIIKCFLDENMSAEQTSPRIWTSVFNKYHLYITSEDFKSYVPLLYGYETALSDDQRYVIHGVRIN